MRDISSWRELEKRVVSQEVEIDVLKEAVRLISIAYRDETHSSWSAAEIIQYFIEQAAIRVSRK